MLYSEILKLGVGLNKDVAPEKVYPLCSLVKGEDAKEVVKILKEFGYDLSSFNIANLRLLTLNKKDMKALLEVLTKIEELKLHDIFSYNLNVRSLNSSVLARVEVCLKNNIPFVHRESNDLISEIYNEEAFMEYTNGRIKSQDEAVEASPVEVKENMTLDEEDNMVRSDILKTLLEVKEENKDDFTFGFLITSIIANLDNVIASDNKEYRITGNKHIIERALEGISLTPDMQSEIDNKILSAFPDVNDLERGV